ncbi:MAG: polymorphic toxin type 50 domain-containing protein [Firmicutes bacterium]|nr:polymorphic toxin type 50 domain-containing protein [Bacillota bacterium]
MGAGNSGLFNGTKGGKRTKDGLPLTVNKDKQNKHIKGSRNFKQGKSEITISQTECQKLVEQYSGKGIKIGNKERVDFKVVIGVFVDRDGNKGYTTVGMIHYSKTGVHIVPSRPLNWED